MKKEYVITILELLLFTIFGIGALLSATRWISIILLLASCAMFGYGMSRLMKALGVVKEKELKYPILSLVIQKVSVISWVNMVICAEVYPGSVATIVLICLTYVTLLISAIIGHFPHPWED